MREPPHISESHLRACLQAQYHLHPTTIEYLPIGLDYSAGVYRVLTGQGNPYLLKASSRPLYEPACLVPRYLHDQGITSVVAPLPTKHNTLWTHLDNWTLIVYPFLDGDTSWTGMTDEQWQETGSIFNRIHQIALPPSGFESLRRETFDPTGYAQQVHAFETQHILLPANAQNAGSASQQTLRASWLTHQSTIHHVVASLQKQAATLQRRSGPYVICHADLHPANLLRDPSGHVFVLDWDEVILAPKERDFLFAGEPPTDDTTKTVPPFFQGYGPAEIDWAALTYYGYERVIQDVIACSQTVFLRDDLGEDSKADEANLFHKVLTEDGEIAIAYAAAAHLTNL